MSLYLLDKSALARMRLQTVQDRLAPIFENTQAATCTIVDLEVLYSARGAEDHEEIRQRRELSYQRIPIDETILRRAVEVQGLLAQQNLHRVPIADLIIAAAAESADATVLHYDKDFDIIASVTGQATEWVAPAGSL